MEPKKDAVGHEVKILSNMIKRRIDNAAVFTENEGITGMHGWIMGYLYRHSEKRDIFQRDIEAEFSIRRSTATGMLQLMEKNGLIQRDVVKHDARLKKLVLTPKAIAIHEAVIRELNEMEKQLVNGLTREEIDLFFKVIRKMRNNIE